MVCVEHTASRVGGASCVGLQRRRSQNNKAEQTRREESILEQHIYGVIPRYDSNVKLPDNNRLRIETLFYQTIQCMGERRESIVNAR